MRNDCLVTRMKSRDHHVGCRRRVAGSLLVADLLDRNGWEVQGTPQGRALALGLRQGLPPSLCR